MEFHTTLLLKSSLVPDSMQRLSSNAAGAGTGAGAGARPSHSHTHTHTPLSLAPIPSQTWVHVPVCLHFVCVICNKGKRDRELESRFTRIVWEDIGDTSNRGNTGSHSHPSNSSPTVEAQNTSLLSAGSGGDTVVLLRLVTAVVAGVPTARFFGIDLLTSSHTNIRRGVVKRAQHSSKAPILSPSHVPSLPELICTLIEDRKRGSRNTLQKIQGKEEQEGDTPASSESHLEDSGYFSQTHSQTILPSYIPWEAPVTSVYFQYRPATNLQTAIELSSDNRHHIFGRMDPTKSEGDGPMLPAHLASIEQARAEGFDSETSWEGSEGGEEEDESGWGDGVSDEDEESDEEEDESDDEEGESGKEDEVDVAGDTASGKETDAQDERDEGDTRDEGDSQEKDPGDLTPATSRVRALALRTVRPIGKDLREVDLSEIISPEELEFARKRPKERGSLPRETEAQASMAQSDPTSFYSEEITWLYALPKKQNTRFMHVWNMFDREKTGKV
ncbi:hypothetical protein BGX38DRAFT_374208 [Terfezia claveryi]|nr:hypothetical protein BGX38DRAFT_374208 [Terfezia claveryi]